MYYNMSRHAFGDIQSKLFPKYFLSGSVLSVIALATYCLMNPIEKWSSSEYYQVSKKCPRPIIVFGQQKYLGCVSRKKRININFIVIVFIVVVV